MLHTACGTAAPFPTQYGLDRSTEQNAATALFDPIRSGLLPLLLTCAAGAVFVSEEVCAEFSLAVAGVSVREHLHHCADLLLRR